MKMRGNVRISSLAVILLIVLVVLAVMPFASSADVDDEVIDMDEIERELRELAKLPAAASPSAPPTATPTDDESCKNEERVPPRPPPCLDTNPKCEDWARRGECEHAREYMHLNCKMSCHLCNPLNLNKDRRGNEGIYQRYPGVKQKRVFDEDIEFSRYVSDRAFNAAGEIQPIELTQVWEPPFTEGRVREVMQTIDRYLWRERAQYEKVMTALKASEKPEDFQAEAVVVADLCRNNDRHCAVWAAYGYCEINPRAMQDLCPLACHTCRKYYPGLAQKAKEEKLGSTFFERMDMVGMYDAIWEKRVVAPMIWEADGGTDGDKSSYKVSNMTRKGYAIRQVFGVDRVVSGFQRSVWKRNEEYEDRDIIDMYNFLDDEDINEAFEFIKARGVSEAEGGDGMGFGPKTEEWATLAGEESLVRKSSETFVYDPYSHDPKDKDEGNSLSSIIFKIVAKIEILTGIPARSHFELPIKFMKFEAGDHQDSSLHFGTSVNVSDANLRNFLNTYDYTVGQFAQGNQILNDQIEEAGLENSENPLNDLYIRPRTMNNPRVFGLTIFLNSGMTKEAKTAGSILIHGKHIRVQRGMALFYPTVESLLGTNHSTSEDDGVQHAFDVLDRDYDKGDGTYLTENIETGIEYKNDGMDGAPPIYVMQMYFRRFPDLRPQSTYSLDGRTHDGRPLEYGDVEEYVRMLLSLDQPPKNVDKDQ